MKQKSNSTPITVANGLAAWIGGVAFSVGAGLAAPVWVAAPLTVLSIGLAAIARTQGRRTVDVRSA